MRRLALLGVGLMGTGLAAAAAAASAPHATVDHGLLAREARWILIEGRVLDPVQGLAPEPLAELDVPAREHPAGTVPDETIRLVQAEGSDLAAFSRRLEGLGAQVLGFVPNAAFLVRVPDRLLPALTSVPGLRAEMEYRAAWKIQPSLADAMRSGGGPAAGETSSRVLVEFFPGASPDLHADLMASIPGVEILSIDDSDLTPSTLLDVSGAALGPAARRLALLRDVQRVDLAPPPRPLVDHAAWFVQSGDDITRETNYSVSAPLFARGITGRGILVGLLDDGLENDHCQFTYRNEVDEAAWPIGPSGDDVNAVPAEGRLRPTPAVRTRERRVVAYYVQGGAAPYSSPNQHGTIVAEVMLGDHNLSLAARPLIRDIGDSQNVLPNNPTGDWVVGEQLRSDLIPFVDDINADDPSLPNTFGPLIEHHQPGDGIAPGAQLVMLDIGNASGSLTGTTSVGSMLRQARRTGATVANISFGGFACTDCYAGSAPGADAALWAMRDLVVVASAGNEGGDGPRTIGRGVAHSKSAITVGATVRSNSTSSGTARLGEDVVSFSSLGPATGGRQAPEVMAPGIVSVRADSTSWVTPENGSGSGDRSCGSDSLLVQGGTSFSAAATSGMAALVQQYFLDGFYPGGLPTAATALRPTNALVRAVIVNSTRDLGGARTDDSHAGRASRPTFGQGWGAPRLDDALYFLGDPTTRHPGTQRARLLVLNDVANGVDGTLPLTLEPGGLARDAIIPSFRPAIAERAIHEFFVVVQNPDRADRANDLRVTLAWSDPAGTSASMPLVNDLDLEVIGPGPDGVLQTVGGIVGGDDVVYRPNPRTAWSAGFSVPSADRRIAPPSDPASLDFADRDPINTLENVFVRSADVDPGTWRIRVVGRRVPSTTATDQGMPNFVLNDTPPVFDTDGDGVPDLDDRDVIFGTSQGYALIATGRVVMPAPRLAPPRLPPGCPGPRVPREGRGVPR